MLLLHDAVEQQAAQRPVDDVEGGEEFPDDAGI
jgi:hypothetical protein